MEKRKKYLMIDSDNFQVSKFLGLGFDELITLRDFVATAETVTNTVKELQTKASEESTLRDAYLQLHSDELEKLTLHQTEFPDRYVEFDLIKKKIVTEAPFLTVTAEDIRKAETRAEVHSLTQHELIPGCDYYVVGKSCFEHIKNNNHLGLRKAYYGNVAKLPRLGLNNDIGLKFVDWIPQAKDINYFLSDEFKDFGIKPIIGITKDAASSIQWLKYFSDPAVGWLGLDYETNDFPLKFGFRGTGVSISSVTHSIFISFDELQKCGQLEEVLLEYKKFLQCSDERIWVFNLSFEQRASYQYFKEFYNFYDAVTVNLIEERNAHFLSLKYTAQLLLKVNSWDDSFDFFVDKLSALFNKYGWGPQENNLWLNDELVSELTSKFPTQEDEIILKIKEEWGNQFAAIPADILGHYCCLDAFYTLQIGLYTIGKYSMNCIDAYNGNIQLGARLQTVGIFKDVEVYDDYKLRTEKYLSWAVFHCVRYHYLKRRSELSGKVNDYNLYPSNIKRLIEHGLYMENNIDLGKTIMATCANENYEFGLDENKLIEILGVEGRDEVLQRVKGYVGKYGPTSNRKRSMFHDLSNYFIREYKFPEEYREFHENTMQSMNVERNLKLMEDCLFQFSSMDTVPNEIKFNDELQSPSQFYEYLIQCHLNMRAPAVYSGFVEPLHNDNKMVMAFLTFTKDYDEYRDMIDLKNTKTDVLTDTLRFKDAMIQLPSTSPWKKLFVDQITAGYEQVGWNTYDYCNMVDSVQVNYPEQYQDFRQWVRSGKMEVGHLNTYLHMTLCIRVFKRYHKLYSSYLTGMLVNTDAAVNNFDENWVSIHANNPPRKDETKAVRMYPKFGVCEKTSKRWGAGIHTIYSYADVKRVIGSPSDCLLSYFDISQAEVRTIAYLSGDEKMVHAYENKIDLYISTAKMFNPNASPEYIKRLRSDFKVVLLAYFYNQGDKSLAEMIHKTVDEVKELKAQLRIAYGTAVDWCDRKVAFAVKHKGLLDTILGDRIKLEDSYRLAQQGVNIPVQGFTAVALAYGFNNILKQAQIHKVRVQPMIVVHDSATNMFHVDELLTIGKFYYEHFTEYVYKKFKVRYEFKTLIGTNYFDMVEFSVEGDNKITLKGENLAITQIMTRLESNNIKFDVNAENSMEIKGYATQEDLFINEGAKPNFFTDKSWNKVELTIHK